MSDHQIKNLQKEYSFFRVNSSQQNFSFELIDEDNIYDGQGFYKKAKGEYYLSNQKLFTDDKFTVQIPLNRSRLDYRQQNQITTRRLYEVYEDQDSIFQTNQHANTVDQLENFPHFIAEMQMIDMKYLQTLFITQKITKNGEYHYFIKRNGEYYLEVMDDVIPVKGKKLLPYWGLSYNKPWQLILMKAWMKEKRGIKGVDSSQPFEFIEAFGMPGYRIYSFKKQLQFINKELVDSEMKRKKINQIVLRSSQFEIIAKTKDHFGVQKLGLVSDRAAYFAQAVENNMQLNGEKSRIYLIRSLLPSKWVGSISAASNKCFKTVYDQVNRIINVEKQFFVTERELFQVFNKFYASPTFERFYSGHSILQDSYKIPANQHSNVFKLIVKTKGNININIQLAKETKKRTNSKQRYPHITYILARLNSNNDIKVNVSRLRIEQQGQDENEKMEVTYKQKFEFWEGDYVPGYHKSCNRFFQAEVGQYYMFVKLSKDNQIPYVINLNTNCKVQNGLTKQNLNKQQFKQFFDSTMYSYARKFGFEINLGKQKKNQRIIFGNSFEQIGYGFLSIITMIDSTYKYAMKIYPQKLEEAGYRICSYYDDQDQKSIIKVSKKGNPQIIVLKKIARNIQMKQRFPPEGTVQFYRITV